MAKAGFTTVYELDGAFLLTGGTVLDRRSVDGVRSACTSIQAVDAANRVLSLVARLVEYVQANADSMANLVESDLKRRPSTFDLAVVRVGPVVVLRDESTGAEFINDGVDIAYRHPAGTGVHVLSKGTWRATTA